MAGDKSLPEDLLVDIFTKRLCGEAIRACRRVCKTWRSLIVKHFGMINNSNHDMVSDHGTRVYMSSNSKDTHISLSSFNGCNSSLVKPTKIRFTDQSSFIVDKRLVGYSNGVACLLFQCNRYNGSLYEVVLWNTSINTIQIVGKSWHVFAQIILGFGFGPQTRDYKVVMLVEHGNESGSSVEVEVYSLKSDSWKNLSTAAKYIDSISSYPQEVVSPNTFVRGNAHWIVHKKRHDPVILCFNMEEEVFHEIDIPTLVSGSFVKCLTRFRDSLALFMRIEYTKVEVWEMTDYGFSDSWSRLYRFTELGFYNTYEIMDTGKILHIDYWKDKFAYYDPETGELTELRM